MSTWQLQQAKAHLSELVASAVKARNLRDFHSLGVATVNPFEGQ